MQSAHAFFDQLKNDFALHAQPKTLIKRRFTCSGANLELEFTETELEPLVMQALAHHPQNSFSGTPSLKISIFSNTEFAQTLDGLWMKRGEVQGFQDDERFIVSIQGNGEVVNAFDTKEHQAFCWYRSTSSVPDYIRAAPLLHPFHLGLGAQLLHAGAVGINGRGLLIAGRGGSGKSTTCTSCLLKGLVYLGDDYTAFTDDDVPTAHSLYSSAKLFEKNLSLTPGLSPMKDRQAAPTDEKVLFFLTEHFPERLVPSLTIAGILLPSVSNQKSTMIKPAGAAKAMAALAPSSIFQLPHAGAEAFRRIAALTKKVPCYFVELGENPEEVAERIKDFLTETAK